MSVALYLGGGFVGFLAGCLFGGVLGLHIATRRASALAAVEGSK